MSTPKRQKNEKEEGGEEGKQDQRSRYWTVHPKMRRGTCVDRGAGTRGTGREEKREKRERRLTSRMAEHHFRSHWPFSIQRILVPGNTQWVRARDHGCTVQRAELRQHQAESYPEPFFCTLAFSIPILCLLISLWILSSSRPHKHQAVRSVQRKRTLDE